MLRGRACQAYCLAKKHSPRFDALYWHNSEIVYKGLIRHAGKVDLIYHVMIQLEAPKHQIGCFLQDIAAGITPQVVEGSAIDGACASGPALLETVQQEPF